ncbi:hypothetical protein ACFY2M_37880 [Streptomyces sp. NPDC001276]|uniref:hypothetical protein n=1 Tax=Streptomyces sp. NPDC001276 TaxID=3364555 RepID=UPI0036C64157
MTLRAPHPDLDQGGQLQVSSDPNELQIYEIAMILEKLTEIRRFITASSPHTPPSSPRAGGSST